MLLVMENTHKTAVLLDEYPHHLPVCVLRCFAGRRHIYIYASTMWFGQSRGVLMLRYRLNARIKHLVKLAD